MGSSLSLVVLWFVLHSVVPAINLKSKPAVTSTPQGKIGFVNFVSNATVYVLLKTNYTYSLIVPNLKAVGQTCC